MGLALYKVIKKFDFWPLWLTIQDLNKMKTELSKQPFPQPAEPVGAIDVGKHLVKQFEDNKGRSVR